VTYRAGSRFPRGWHLNGTRKELDTMRETNPALHRQRVSESLIGKFGSESRRWKGENAGYVAKHLWMTKHFSKPDRCDLCGNADVSRIEWANISGEYKRNRDDWLALCPSCHRKMDYRKNITHCPNGHEYTEENIYINHRGHRECRICRAESQRRYKNAKAN